MHWIFGNCLVSKKAKNNIHPVSKQLLDMFKHLFVLVIPKTINLVRLYSSWLFYLGLYWIKLNKVHVDVYALQSISCNCNVNKKYTRLS